MARDGAEIVEQARKYLANLNKETGANVQKDLGQYWANYGQGPDMTPKNTAIQYEPQKKNARTDMQKKKEDRLEVKSTVNYAQIKRDRTKKQYDDYINSEEYRQKQAESVRAQQQAMDQDETQIFSSTSDMQMPTPKQDQKEYMLRMAKDAAEREYNESEDRKVIEQDLEAITGLSEDERKQLEQYFVNRDLDYYEGITAASQGDFSTPYLGRAEQEASDLIEKYGLKRVQEMANTLDRMRNAEMTESVATLGQQQANSGFMGGAAASAASVPVGVLSGPAGILDRAKELTRKDDRFKTLDPNSLGNLGNVYSGAVRGQVGENIVGTLGDGFLGKAASTGYQTVMSAADSVARAYMGGGAFGGATLAATGSFSQTMADASRQGATPAQAALLATATAGIEAATEKIPIDDLIKVAKGKGKSTVLKNLLRQAGIEASTEELSLFGTMLAEAAILQEKSQYNQTLYTELLAGKPEAEARQAAAMEIWNEVVNTALVSGLSGGLSSLGGSYADYRGWFADTQEQINPELNRPKNSQQAVQDAIANDQSADGGQIKGTGAAERNFTRKPTYNAILSEDNAQPDRRSDARPMELPATDVNGGNVSATTANVYGSQNTPDDLASAMEEPVARGDFSYVRISNDAATQRAQQTIGESGSWESARDNFRMDVDRGLAGAELSARGALILNHAAEVYEQAKASGDPQAAATAKREWLTILSDVQKLGTNTAQGLQALRIIRDLMPQDKIQFAQIAVQNMVRDMKLGADIQIDQQLLTDYENATTDQQRDEIIEKIQQNVADQIPSTILDKWNALRYTNMLGNLKTNVRNVAGNVANTAVYRFKDAIGAVLESIANKVSRGKTGRTKSLVVNKQLQKAMEPYYQQVKNAVSSGGKYGENNTAAGDFAQGVMDKRQIFKFKPLESYRKATNWMMNNEYFGDEAFGKAAFTHAMAGYLQANGVKDIQNASPELLDRAMVYAVKEAQETTFHDNSALANVLGKLKKDTGIVGEGLIPFTKTPANVLTRAEEYSPLGILNTAILSAQKVAGNTKLADANGRLGSWAARGQDITGTDIINSLSKTLTGSAIFALGAILKSHGILNGGPDEDDEQAAFDRMNGIQPYSINLPDGTTYTLDWLTPVAMPLFMGAQLMDIASDKDLTFADLEQVFTSIADPMIQMSMMQGINSSLESIRYSENNMGQFFINAAVNYLTQGLTNTLLGQLERSTEENRMTTYVDKESQVPQWMQQSLGKASQKIPGWDFQQTEYIDARGEKQRNEGGIAYELLSPGYSQKVRDDAVTREMNRLRESTGENVFPNTASKTITYTDKQGTVHTDHNLTAEQYQAYAQTKGKEASKLWNDVVNAEDYKALTDAQKAKVSSDIEAYARKTGEIAAIGKDHTGYSEGWMQDVQKNGAMEILQKTIESGLSSARSDIGNAWENGYDESAFIREMETAFNTYKNASKRMQRQVYEEASSETKNYIDARNGGISNEQYLEVEKALSKTGGTIVEKSSAIVKQSGLSENQKIMLVKQNVTDTQDENIDLLLQMGYGISDYVELYDDYKNYTKGTGKKNRTINKWMKDYGISYGAAKKLYEVFP